MTNHFNKKMIYSNSYQVGDYNCHIDGWLSEDTKQSILDSLTAEHIWDKE